MIKKAFNAGWASFKNGGAEIYQGQGRSDMWRKEYTRGWESAYFVNQSKVN